MFYGNCFSPSRYYVTAEHSGNSKNYKAITDNWKYYQVAKALAG